MRYSSVMKILISTVIRNDAKYLRRYRDQVAEIVKFMPQHEFKLNIFENDSVDDTKQLLRELDFSFCPGSIELQTLNWPFYESVPDKDRVLKLAHCRNQTLSGIDDADYLLVIDADLQIPFDTARKVIEREGAEDADVYSGVALAKGLRNAEVVNHAFSEYHLYDNWATRRTPDEMRGDLYPDFKNNPVQPFWTTMNGICIYRAQPFKEGARYTAINPRTGEVDCETAMICEEFRYRGYDKIYVNQSAFCFH